MANERYNPNFGPAPTPPAFRKDPRLPNEQVIATPPPQHYPTDNLIPKNYAAMQSFPKMEPAQNWHSKVTDPVMKVWDSAAQEYGKRKESAIDNNRALQTALDVAAPGAVSVPDFFLESAYNASQGKPITQMGLELPQNAMGAGIGGALAALPFAKTLKGAVPVARAGYNAVKPIAKSAATAVRNFFP